MFIQIHLDWLTEVMTLVVTAVDLDELGEKNLMLFVTADVYPILL